MSVHLKNRKTFQLSRLKRNRATNRAKSFSSEDAANAYAKENGIENYELHNKAFENSAKKKIVIIKKD